MLETFNKKINVGSHQQCLTCQEPGFLVSNGSRYGGGWGCGRLFFEETFGVAAPMSCCTTWLDRHTLWPAGGIASIFRSADAGREIRWCFREFGDAKRLQDGNKFRSWWFVFCVYKVVGLKICSSLSLWSVFFWVSPLRGWSTHVLRPTSSIRP